MEFDSSIPFLVYDFYSETHFLVPSQYHIPLSEDKQKLHTEIINLHKQGIDYRRIHRILVKKGFKIGKSPSTIDSIIKKRTKREQFLNQPVIEEYRNFDIEFLRIQN